MLSSNLAIEQFCGDIVISASRVSHNVGHHLFRDISKHELLEVHRNKISLHYAKKGYNYYDTVTALVLKTSQTIRASLSDRAKGALAFLVVVSPAEMPQKVPNPPSTSGGNRINLSLVLQ